MSAPEDDVLATPDQIAELAILSRVAFQADVIDPDGLTSFDEVFKRQKKRFRLSTAGLCAADLVLTSEPGSTLRARALSFFCSLALPPSASRFLDLVLTEEEFWVPSPSEGGDDEGEGADEVAS